MTDVQALLASVGLTFSMVVTAASMRARLWTVPGMLIAFGNRDKVPDPSPAAARADRAAKNMLEAMVFFLGVMLAASLAGADRERVALGAQIFFFARLVYFFVYVAGIPFLRTAIWGVGLAGIGVVGLAALG